MDRIESYLNNGKMKNVNEDDLTWDENKLFISEAPEPDDVDWEFIHTDTKRKIYARIISWTISFFFMLSGFLVLAIITHYQGTLIDNAY